MRKRLQSGCVFCIWLLLFPSVELVGGTGKVYHIRTADELAALNLNAGDKVVMERGNWKDQQLVFRGQGTDNQPIQLAVSTPGTVVLTGNSSLEIDGSWLVVDGLYFSQGSTGKRHVIRFSERSENCRLTNTAVEDYSNEDNQVRNSWIVVLGKNNRVDHCYTRGKTNSGPTLHVGPTVEENTYIGPHHHRIDHNYFAHRPPLGRNGGESIVIGSGKWYDKSFQTLVEFNVFEHCDGESEVISTKAVNNTIRYNLFYESKGMLYLRHGDANTVYGNYFIGNHVEGTGGVHIIGKHQRVFNNYFYGLTNGVVIRNGWQDPPSYTQVDDLQIEHNTFVACRQTVVFGWDKDPKAVLPAVNSSVSANVFVSDNPDIVWTREGDRRDAQAVVIDRNVLLPMPSRRKPDMITGNGLTLEKNKWGIYEPVGGISASGPAGVLPMADVQQVLLGNAEIGPSWMKFQERISVK